MLAATPTQYPMNGSVIWKSLLLASLIVLNTERGFSIADSRLVSRNVEGFWRSEGYGDPRMKLVPQSGPCYGGHNPPAPYTTFL